MLESYESLRLTRLHIFSFVEANIKDAPCVIVMAPSFEHLKFNGAGWIPRTKYDQSVCMHARDRILE